MPISHPRAGRTNAPLFSYPFTFLYTTCLPMRGISSLSHIGTRLFFKYSTFCRNKSGLKFFFWRFTSMTTVRFFSSFKATMSISFCPSFNSHQEPMSRYNSLFPPRNDGAQSSWTRSGWNCPWFYTGWLVFLPLPGWDAGGLSHYNLPWAVSAGLQRSFLPIIQLWTGY